MFVKKETEDSHIEIKKEPGDSFNENKKEPKDEIENRFIEIKQEANLKEEEMETLDAMLADDSNSNLPPSCSSSASAANHRGQGRTATSTPLRLPEATPTLGAKKIMRQVEHYFGDFNLPRDKFLSAETKKADGWVTMETMMKFKRLSQLSSDAAVIVAAIKQSKSGLIQVSQYCGAEKILASWEGLPMPLWNCHVS